VRRVNGVASGAGTLQSAATPGLAWTEECELAGQEVEALLRKKYPSTASGGFAEWFCRAHRFSSFCIDERTLVAFMSTEIEKPYEGAFVGDTHYFALRVYIEDTDLGGVVYHANYLRFLERARSDLLRAAGIDQRAAIETGQGVYAVAEMHIKYCKPARLEDDLVIVSHLQQIRGASSIIGQKIMRGQDILVEATVTVAFLTAEGRPRRQPPEWVEKFHRIKGKPN
jgi:acyl-CoA thioester hydrolase